MVANEPSPGQNRSFPAYAEHPAVVARKRYPGEKQYPWLSTLSDAYAVDDYEREADIRLAEAQRGQSVACHEGCANCCRIHAIPVMPLEFMGISWYLLEVCSGDIMRQIRPRLLNYSQSAECPFLLSASCAIYPVRPLACRDFFVFGKPCQPTEDPFVTRPYDMHPPNLTISRYVAFRLFDYEGFHCANETDKEKAFYNGAIVANSRPMHELDWAAFVQRSRSFFK